MIKILAVFALILALNRIRIHLSVALLTGSLILGLWTGLTPLGIITSVAGSVTSMQTISLILIVGMIMVMSRIMEKSGHMTRLVKSFTNISKDARAVGPFMSALIGLLPMPGGALFSAPMVEASLSKSPVNVEQKTAINYWFRHIWEYWWPLYPGVILAVALLEVETWRYMAVMAPMTIISILAGIIFILSPIGKTGLDHQGGLSWSGIREFLWEMIPILIVIIFIIALTGAAAIIGLAGFSIRMPPLLSILPGLAISIIWVSYINHIPLSEVRSAIASRDNLIMIFLVIAIMVFKGIMEDSNAVVNIRDEMIAYRIPVIFLILIMPFLSGLVLGIAIGFVGVSFPLIIPLFNANNLLEYLSMAGLAYTFGYMGMMLSPVHLCLLVTKDYFKASLLRSYRYIIRPILAVMLASVVLFLCIRALS
jgi:integral membrane protein (TIGR00529 family)